jgi:hypothetical protein
MSKNVKIRIYKTIIVFGSVWFRNLVSDIKGVTGDENIWIEEGRSGGKVERTA